MSLALWTRLVGIALLGVLTAGMAQSPSRPAPPQLPDLSPETGANPETTSPVNPNAQPGKPRLVPARDVTVTWTVQVAGGAPVERTQYYSVTQSKKRDSYGRGFDWITDISQNRVFVVLPSKHLYYKSSGAIGFSTLLPRETSFHRGASETIAGLSCMHWNVAAPDGYRPDFCITDDGVLLRLTDENRRMVATKVDYGPQDPSLFSAPVDFTSAELPPLGPLHDAIITYRGEHADTDQLKEDVFARNTTVAVAPVRQMARFQGTTPDYLIVDDAARRVTEVTATQKTYRKQVLTTADRPALLYLYGWPLRIAGRAKFTRAEETTIAGLSCTTWHIRDESDNPWFDVCVSDDGLILRFAGMRSQDAAAIEAVDVLYGPPSGSLFTVPDDFQEVK